MSSTVVPDASYEVVVTAPVKCPVPLVDELADELVDVGSAQAARGEQLRLQAMRACAFEIVMMCFPMEYVSPRMQLLCTHMHVHA